MELKDLYNLYSGQTCLIVGVGPNLRLTPPEWFDYPSFGVNTIFRYEGWKPTYYVGVDYRLYAENGVEIAEKYRDVPKFVPRPDRDDFHAENVYRFYHRHGDLSIGGKAANQPDALTKNGISYYRVMDAVMQIAWHMGFKTMLMIGIQHKQNEGNDEDRMHFWGLDEKAVKNQPFDWWFRGYRHFVRTMTDVKVLNISADTYVPDDVLPRDDWRDWKNT